MKRIKLTKEEKIIEDSLDEYVPVKKSERQAIAEALEARLKNADFKK